MIYKAFLGVIALDKGPFYWVPIKIVDTDKFIKFLRKLKKKHGST